MSEQRMFHLGDILSITTGKLVSPRLMDGIYDILNYMTGDDLYTHALPRAADECKPYLLMEMPFLKDISAGVVGRDNWQAWLDKQVELYGEQHAVRPIHHEDHEVLSPFEELDRMGVSADKVLSVDLDELED